MAPPAGSTISRERKRYGLLSERTQFGISTLSTTMMTPLL